LVNVLITIALWAIAVTTRLMQHAGHVVPT
jgi:hypothetical protein